MTDANPVVGTNKAAEEISRDRVLSDEELRVVWSCAGEGDYGAIIRSLILTGQRREEIAAIRSHDSQFLAYRVLDRYCAASARWRL